MDCYIAATKAFNTNGKNKTLYSKFLQRDIVTEFNQWTYKTENTEVHTPSRLDRANCFLYYANIILMVPTVVNIFILCEIPHTFTSIAQRTQGTRTESHLLYFKSYLNALLPLNSAINFLMFHWDSVWIEKVWDQFQAT